MLFLPATWIGCKFCCNSARSPSCFEVQSIMTIRAIQLGGHLKIALTSEEKTNPLMTNLSLNFSTLPSPRTTQILLKLKVRQLIKYPNSSLSWVLSPLFSPKNQDPNLGVAMFFHGRQLHTVFGVLEWLVTGIDEQRNGLEVAPQSQKPLQSVGSRALKNLSCVCHVHVTLWSLCKNWRTLWLPTNNLKLLKRLSDWHALHDAR